jgi:hypothetical protein
MDPELHRQRAAEQEAADARATTLLKRIGIFAIIVLLLWIAFVVWSFRSG